MFIHRALYNLYQPGTLSGDSQLSPHRWASLRPCGCFQTPAAQLEPVRTMDRVTDPLLLPRAAHRPTKHMPLAIAFGQRPS